jgi:hypothetical protein
MMQILGVQPNAEAKDIKLAYYSLMREVHPDRSSDVYSTQLCAVLNEIYEVTATTRVRWARPIQQPVGRHPGAPRRGQAQDVRRHLRLLS